MLHDEVDKLLEYANELLAAVEHEMERSHEDVVTHLGLHEFKAIHRQLPGGIPDAEESCDSTACYTSETPGQM